MSIDVSATFSKEEVKKEGIGLIDMYILNASSSGFDPLYFANWNHDVYGFAINATGDMTSNIELYTGLHITREAVKTTVESETPGISISIPNVNRTVESYIQNRNYLRGCDIYTLTSFIKHLPSAEAELSYTGQTGEFTSGERLIQWNASGTVVASALIAYDSNNIVYLKNIEGTFESGKIIGQKSYGSDILSGESWNVGGEWGISGTEITATANATNLDQWISGLALDENEFYISTYEITANSLSGGTLGQRLIFIGQPAYIHNVNYIGTPLYINETVGSHSLITQAGSGPNAQYFQFRLSSLATGGAITINNCTAKKITNAAVSSSGITYNNISNFIGTSSDRFSTVKEKLYIDSPSSDENVVSFTCRPKMLIRNKILPGRTFSRECNWAIRGRYAGIECNPSNQINATRLASYPECDGTLDNCIERKNKTRFGGFVSIPDKGIFIG